MPSKSQGGNVMLSKTKIGLFVSILVISISVPLIPAYSADKPQPEGKSSIVEIPIEKGGQKFSFEVSKDISTPGVRLPGGKCGKVQKRVPDGPWLNCHWDIRGRCVC